MKFTSVVHFIKIALICLEIAQNKILEIHLQRSGSSSSSSNGTQHDALSQSPPTAHFLGDKNDLEFGFVLHQEYWGKGFATEIGQFWVDFAKNELQKPRILAAASPKNHASINAIKKLGLTEVKEIASDDRGTRLVFLKEF